MIDPAEFAWNIVRSAARDADAAAAGGIPALYDGATPVVAWRARTGWECVLPEHDGRRALIDLYLPFCSATRARPMTLGHLGESLDGFIATHTGDSQWVTGPENVVHMHRLRALSDAVIVGPGTVAADDPRLTTRLVPGTNPLRVIIDPGRRLGDERRVFVDDSAETLYVCARDLLRSGERHFGRAVILGIGGDADALDLAELMSVLRSRGCTRVFVEGGGVTVSSFLQAQLLDRLHLAIAPLLIGNGRAAIRLPAPAALGDCHRPRYRVFRMGGDVLFDCDLRSRSDDTSDGGHGPIARVI